MLLLTWAHRCPTELRARLVEVRARLAEVRVGAAHVGVPRAEVEAAAVEAAVAAAACRAKSEARLASAAMVMVVAVCRAALEGQAAAVEDGQTEIAAAEEEAHRRRGPRGWQRVHQSRSAPACTRYAVLVLCSMREELPPIACE